MWVGFRRSRMRILSNKGNQISTVWIIAAIKDLIYIIVCFMIHPRSCYFIYAKSHVLEYVGEESPHQPTFSLTGHKYSSIGKTGFVTPICQNKCRTKIPFFSGFRFAKI